MLYDNTEKEKVSVEVERYTRGEGTFAIMRFRNKEDLIEFADLIDEPQIKNTKRNSLKKIVWHGDAEQRNSLSSLFE